MYKISFIALATITAIILIWLSFYIPNRNTEYALLKADYDSLLVAKQEKITIIDTVFSEKIVLKKEFIPVHTFDTLYKEKMYIANWYHEQHSDTNLMIDFSILTFGEMKHFDFKYEVYKKTEIINNIVYKHIEMPQRSVYLNGAVSSDLSVLSFNLSYHTKKNISFNTGLLLHQNNPYWMIGVGWRIY